MLVKTNFKTTPFPALLWGAITFGYPILADVKSDQPPILSSTKSQQYLPIYFVVTTTHCSQNKIDI